MTSYKNKITNVISMYFKILTGVCTLRLDFESFTTAGPVGTSDVTAAIDTFQITTVRNIKIFF